MPEIRWYKDGTCLDIARYPRFSSTSSEGTVSITDHNYYHLIFRLLICKVDI